MKKILLLLIVLFITQSTFSQKIILHRNAGGDQTYQLSSVDSISFQPFLCGDEIRYEGKTYGTVLIGTQCWMKKNLDIGTMIEGPSISPTGKQTNNQIIEKYCYDNDTANCSTYGGLYEWNEAMQYVTAPGTKGICPDGWHIPTYAEFDILRVGTNDVKSLLEIGTDGGTNTTGFSALYAGYVYTLFENLNGGTWWWSSNQYSATHAHYFTITASDFRFYDNWKWYGISVRCIKD